MECQSTLCICHEGKCVNCKVGSGHIPTDRTKCATCLIANCGTCNQDYTVCTACNNGYTLVEGECSSCSEDKCLEHQDDTTTQATTTKSRFIRMLQSKDSDKTEKSKQLCKCTKCAPGYTLDTQTGSCTAKCLPNCKEGQCNINDTCFECADGFGLRGPNCEPCKDKNCADCAYNSSECRKCVFKTFQRNVALDNNNKTFGLRCVKWCPRASICKNFDGKPTSCQKHFQYGIKTSSRRRILQLTADTTKEITCERCKDVNCQDCGDDYNVCVTCKTGFAKDTTKKDQNPLCSKCAKSECDQPHYTDDGQCSCKHCRYPASNINGECVFKVKIDNCSSDWSNQQNKCSDCNEGFAINNTGGCTKCAYENCLECDDNIAICERCATGFLPIKFQDKGKDYAACKEVTCDPGCNCTLGQCSSCKELYGQQQKGGGFNCVKCIDPSCKICANNYFICDECLDEFGLQVQTTTTKKTTKRILQRASGAGQEQATTWPDGKTYKCSKCQAHCYRQGWSQKCVQVCAKCSTDNSKCEKCVNGLDMVNGACVYTCNIAGCQACDSKTTCRQCSDGYFKKGTTCIKCDEECASCYQPKQCSTCIKSTHSVQYASDWQSSSCKPNCSVIHRCGTCTLNGTTFTCIGCEPRYGLMGYGWSKECTKCQDVNCYDCAENYLQCKKCTSILYKLTDKNICIPSKCQENCVTCSQLYQCDKCTDGFGIGPVNWVTNPSPCRKCFDINCLLCNDDFMKCTSCEGSYKLNTEKGQCDSDCNAGCNRFQCVSNGHCKSCKEGYGKKGEDCDLCDGTGCDSCTDDYKTCCRCDPNFKLDNGKCSPICGIGCKEGQCASPGQCNKDACEIGFYFSWTGCRQCGIECQECKDLFTCNKCNTGFEVRQFWCQPLCPDKNCATCSQANVCSYCKYGYHIKDTTCEINKFCDTDLCTKCSEDGKKCLECKSKDYQLQSNGYCQPQCDDDCVSCNGLNSCSYCKSGPDKQGLLDGKCSCTIKNCAQCDRDDDKNLFCKNCDGFSFQLSNDKKSCIFRCRANCTCGTAWNCDGCKPGFEMTQGEWKQCIAKCGNNCLICNKADPTKCTDCAEFYGPDETKACILCKDVNCANCGIDINKCIACRDGFGFSNIKDAKCSDYASGFDESKYLCKVCTLENCTLCNRDNSICDKCIDQFTYNPTLNVCAPDNCMDHCRLCYSVQSCAQCNQGYGVQARESIVICQKCSDDNCYNCQAQSDKCDICKAASKTGLDKQEGICKNCPDNCSRCPLKFDNCQKCDDNFTEVKEDAITFCKWALAAPGDCKTPDKYNIGCLECNEGFIYNDELKHCIQKAATCDDKNCAQCFSDQTCKVCNEGYKLNDSKKCISNCDFAVQGLENCVTCVVQNVCSSCNDGFTVKDGKCSATEEEANSLKDISSSNNKNTGISNCQVQIALLIGILVKELDF